MDYGLLYTIPFSTLGNVPCVVEIEKEGHEGPSTELRAGGSPFTVDIDDEEFMYTPARFSTAKLRVVGGDYLQGLFTTGYRQHRVTLLRGGQVAWCGYVKPELYTQDYVSEVFELEIECVSALSVLEYLDYVPEGEGKRFVSLWRLLQRCVAESRGRYGSVLVPRVYARTAEECASPTENVLDRMAVSEQDFFDEDGKPMKMKEVLEEVCKFLGWTCADWTGTLCLVDADHEGVYRQYDASLASFADASPCGSLSVQDVGFAGAGHSLDVLPGYNKVTVKCSNYPVEGNILEDVDFEHAETLAESHWREEGLRPEKACRKVYMKGEYPDMPLYEVDSGGKLQKVEIGQYEGKPEELNMLLGTRMVGTFVYDPTDESVSECNYEYSLQVRFKNAKGGLEEGDSSPVITYRNANARVFPPGAFFLTGSVMPFYEDEEMRVYEPEQTVEGNVIRASLRIGQKYYAFIRDNQGHWANSETFVNPYHGEGEGFVALKNTKSMDDPYQGMTGFMMESDELQMGDLELRVFVTRASTRPPRPEKEMPFGYYLKDFKLSYQKKDDVRKQESEDTDRIYENVVNEDYINELDEIELKISTYNNDGACYSKVLMDGDYLTDNLYNAILGKQKRPEEMLITRVVNRYSTTRVKLTQELKYDTGITPLSRLTDRFQPGKAFINAGGSIDFRMDKFECVMIEA